MIKGLVFLLCALAPRALCFGSADGIPGGPAVMELCSYLGGEGGEEGIGIVVGHDGKVYLTGFTRSDETSFPVKGGWDLTHNGMADVFVARLNAACTEIEYCSFIGGTGDDFGHDIAVDSAGNVYVTGYTESDETSFPVKGGPDVTYNGAGDAFVARINAQGTALDYCGYVGGSGMDSAIGIDVDAQGRAFLAGKSGSDESSFPVRCGPGLVYGGNQDAFVACIDPGGVDFVYCGYIGGAALDVADRVSVDPTGQAYVSGLAESDEGSFPVKIGPDVSFNGLQDAFVAKVKPGGTGLVYCGYIGGTERDSAAALTVDDAGAVYVTGWTDSDETSFPVKLGPDLTFNGGGPFGGDAYVAGVDPSGSGLDFCGYIGGDKKDKGYGVAVDGMGNTWVFGLTLSNESVFPVKMGPDATYNGGQDAFIARINAWSRSMDLCGYLGGVGEEWGHDIAVDAQGRAYVTGYTKSTESSFPVTGGVDPTHNGKKDAFLARVSYAPLTADAAVLPELGGAVQFSLAAGEENKGRTYLLLGTVGGTTPGTPLPFDKAVLPLNWDGFTDAILAWLNNPLFGNFFGALDVAGQGTAQLSSGPVPGFAGTVMHFAYALSDPFDFVSDPVRIEIVP
jgi:hypothetical protein